MSYYNLLLRVNKEEIIASDLLFSLYARVHRLMYSCLHALLRETNYLQLEISDVGAEVAAKLDHNKTIFSRGVTYKKGKIVDLPKRQKAQNNKFLCQCMDLQLAMLRENTEKQSEILDKIPLSKILFEKFLYSWLYNAQDYVNFTTNYLRSRQDNNEVDAQKYLKLMFTLETNLGFDPISTYSLVNYIKLRLHAITAIYTRIHKAYTRVTLGIARKQASSEEYVLDNYQEGSIGLMRAISSYSYLANARFPGYAKWLIRQAILFNLKQSSSVIKITNNTWQHYTHLEQIRAKCEALQGRITTEQLALESGYTEKHIDNIYNNMVTSQVSSLDSQLNDEGFTLMAIKETSPVVEEVYDEEIARIASLVDKLPDDLKRVVCLRYGIVPRQILNQKC